MAAFDDLFDTSVRHAIDLEQYKAGVVKRMLTLLSKLDDDIVRTIRDSDLTDYQAARMLLLESQITNLVNAASDRVQQDLQAELRRMLESELEFYDELAREAVGDAVRDDLNNNSLDEDSSAPAPSGAIATGASIARLTADEVYAAAIGMPFNGRTLKEWFDTLSDNKRRRLLDEIRIGFLSGENLNDIVKRIRGTPSLKFADGILANISRRDAETIIRTAVQYFNNFALRKQMERVGVEFWLYTSVIDRRTSEECRARSGKVYPVSPSSPYPPRHPRCRSVATPLLSRDQVTDIPTYGEWLARQPRNIVYDILGPTKAKLFLRGGLTLDKYIDRRGDGYTIDQLKQRYPVAWQRANLSQAA